MSQDFAPDKKITRAQIRNSITGNQTQLKHN